MRQPPEPPVGTILETEDNINKYRIERTDLGWHIQHAGGSDEFGNRLTSFGGRGISWRAAWSAWGPPSGAAPFREVPAGTPPLPPDPEEPDPRDGMGIDAADGKFDAPPAAQPWTGKRSTPSSAPGAKQREIDAKRVEATEEATTNMNDDPYPPLTPEQAKEVRRIRREDRREERGHKRLDRWEARQQQRHAAGADVNEATKSSASGAGATTGHSSSLWWLNGKDLSALSFNEVSDLAIRAGNLRDEMRRMGDPPERIAEVERDYQRLLEAQQAAGQRMKERRQADGTAGGKDSKAPLAASGAGATTTSGGSGVSHASEGNAQIQQAGQDVEAAMGAIQEIVNQLTQAQQNLVGAADESQHSEADAAKGALEQAISAANDLQQQVGAAKQAVEDVRL